MMLSRLFPLGLSLALMGAVDVVAADYVDQRFTVRGFGTLGMTYNETRGAEFIRDINQLDGPANSWSHDVDTRLGVQLGWRFNSKLDAVVQGVSRYNHEGRYDPQLTWAFLRYAPDAGKQFRLGRVALDMYMLADSRDVGYSYLWVRPPVDYYGVRHITHIDGGDMTLKYPLGQGLLWGKLYAGIADEKISGGLDGVVFDAQGTRVYGGHLNYQWDAWHLQVGATELQYQLDASGEYMQAIQFLEFIDPAMANVLKDIIAPVNMQITSLGLAYDRGRLYVQAMASHLNRPGTEFDIDSAFVTLGYRMQPVTPYVSVSGSRTAGVKLRDLGLNVDGESGLTQQTFSLGARYDLSDNIALKTQLDLINVDQSGFLWRDVQPDWDGKTRVLSVNLDFIF